MLRTQDLPPVSFAESPNCNVGSLFGSPSHTVDRTIHTFLLTVMTTLIQHNTGRHVHILLSVTRSGNSSSLPPQCVLGDSWLIVCFSLSLSRLNVRSLRSSSVSMVLLSFAPVSMHTTNSDKCPFLFCVLHLRRRSIQKLSHLLVVECGIHGQWKTNRAKTCKVDVA